MSLRYLSRKVYKSEIISKKEESEFYIGYIQFNDENPIVPKTLT